MNRTESFAPTRPRILASVPLIVFAVLAALLFLRLGAGDPSHVPSALIGKPVPATALPPLEGLQRNGVPVPGIDPAAFRGRVTIVNVWGSWCGPCRYEHPFLVKIAADERVTLVGINYKDAPENARRFLGRYGNPFAAVGVDRRGRDAIEWGVYGVPETFVVGREGTIVFKHIGEITAHSFGRLQAEIEKALAR